MVEDLGSESVRCGNLGEKEKKGRYLAGVRLMLKGKSGRGEAR